MKSQQEESSDWPQVVAILVATLASLTSGILFTWPTPAIPILISPSYPYNISLEQASYLTVLPPIAIILSSPIYAYIVDRIGRKQTLILVGIPQILAWAFTVYGGEIYVYYLGRFFFGVSDAGYYTVVPTYIAEVATPKVRGSWGNAVTFMVYVGNFLTNLIGHFLGIRLAAVVCLVVPVVFVFGVFWVPESPYFLVGKGKEVEAMQSLRWLRRNDNVEEEFKQISADVKRQMSESGRVKDLFAIASNRKALIVGAFLRGAQQFGGISSFSVYSQFIFQDSVGNLSPSTSSMIYTALLLITNFFAALILDRLGRRKAMIISCLGCSVLLTLESLYFYTNIENFRIFPLVGMSLYVLFYSIGLGIMPTLMLGELFSSSVKGKSLCVMNVFYGICLSVATKLFQLLMSSFGLSVPFAFFAVSCLVSSVASFYFVPETKGKTLEEIQQTLKKNDAKQT